MEVSGRTFTRRSGRTQFVNPRRFGAMTFCDYARFRLSVFTREEAGAIVAYLEFKRDEDPEPPRSCGHRRGARSVLARARALRARRSGARRPPGSRRRVHGRAARAQPAGQRSRLGKRAWREKRSEGRRCDNSPHATIHRIPPAARPSYTRLMASSTTIAAARPGGVQESLFDRATRFHTSLPVQFRHVASGEIQTASPSTSAGRGSAWKPTRQAFALATCRAS